MDVGFQDLISAAIGVVAGAAVVWALFRRVVEDIDHRIAANKESIQRQKDDVDGMEKDLMNQNQNLHIRLSDLFGDMPKEYVRRQEFEATVTDIRARLGGIDNKLDNRFDEVLRAIRKT